MAITWSLCEKHQEPLKLFCEDDETPICLVCDKSRGHEHHKAIPIEEVSQEYKDLMLSRLEILRKEKEKILAYNADAEKEKQELLKQTRAEREKTVAQFRQLRQFLEEQEKCLLAQIEEVEKEIAKKRGEHLARLSKELSSLDSIIQEMEKKCQQPASELLQDVRIILKRSEKETFENPVAFPQELKWKTWDFCDINPFLEGLMKQFKDALLAGLQLQKASVALDPDTANPCLILSEDRKSVTSGERWKDLPDNPERFNQNRFVLGHEGFTTGRHFWEVVVGREDDWAVGVARKSVKRKVIVGLSPEEGFWAVIYIKGTYWAVDSPDSPHLSLTRELNRIRVSLNCDGGRVAFHDADTGSLLYTFSGASVSGESLLPFFSVCKNARLTISP